MKEAVARKQIENIFKKYNHLPKGGGGQLAGITGGKLYELYVLSHVVERLHKWGFSLKFIGNTLKFKASPGKIKLSDPHFEITPPHPNSQKSLWLFVDIEFETLGTPRVKAKDKSRHHEIDIVVVDVDHGNPSFKNIFLGVECKAVAKFRKGILKEVLGIRRELSLLSDPARSLLSALTTTHLKAVPADPPSEYWLAHIDAAGDGYDDSPEAFGIDFIHLEP